MIQWTHLHSARKTPRPCPGGPWLLRFLWIPLLKNHPMEAFDIPTDFNSLFAKPPVAAIGQEGNAARHAAFAGFLILCCGIFFRPLHALLNYAMHLGHDYDQFSHTTLIPFICFVLMLLRRKKIFRCVKYDFFRGGILLITGVVGEVLIGRRMIFAGAENALSLQIAALVLCWIGGFIVFYGGQAFPAALFPLLFLFCMVPLSSALLNAPISIVRNGSSDVAFGLFALFREPVFRQGYVFTLSGVSIEVAGECSGVHSILALIIVSLLAGHLFLSSAWKKVVLVAAALPIVCLTNGVRIGALTLLALHVDPSFLTGSLHHKGGILFLGMAVLLLFGVVFLLQKVAPTVGVATNPAENQETGGRAPCGQRLCS
jgi:exosortase